MKKLLLALILSFVLLNTYADMPIGPSRVEPNIFDIIFALGFIIIIVFPILLLLRKIRKK